MKRRSAGYTMLEVVVALAIFAVALVPAMEAMQNSISALRQTGTVRAGADVSDEQAVLNRMEQLLAMTPATLSANPSGQGTAHPALSEAVGTVPRALVFTSWYVPEEVTEANRFVTANTSRLLWLRVQIENGQASATTLVFIPP